MLISSWNTCSTRPLQSTWLLEELGLGLRLDKEEELREGFRLEEEELGLKLEVEECELRLKFEECELRSPWCPV